MLRSLALAFLLASSVSAQTTWYVDVTGTPPGTGTVVDPYTSIAFALLQASTVSGDTVLVSPGTYSENVTFLGRGVSVISTNGAAVTTINAGGAGSVVSFLSTDGTTMLLRGFTIINGTGTSSGGLERGGGIYASSCIARVRQCIVENNTAFEGGGVYATNSDFDMRGSTVRNNTVIGFMSTGAGLMFSGGTGTLRRCIIQFNTAGTGFAPGKGGGIYAAGPLSVQRCSIADNVGELEGGGIFGGDDVAGCRILRNTSQFGGGAYGTSVVRQSSVQGNRADSTSGSSHFGGGLYGVGLVSKCFIEGNVAFGEGAGAHSSTLTGCTLQNNSTSSAQGYGPISQGGGAAFCTLTNCKLFDNSVSDPNGAAGGGATESTLLGCTLSGNQATVTNGPDPFIGGGGAFNCILNGCDVIGNTTNSAGGGIYLGSATSTEFIGNDAGWGGGVAGASINRCTVFGNTAGSGADGVHIGAFQSNTVLDSIIWMNGTLEIQVEPMGSIGVTYSDVLGGWGGTGNINLDPQFWNPGTSDVHLQAASPCIDAGNPVSPLDPNGTRADMGAHPYDPSYSG